MAVVSLLGLEHRAQVFPRNRRSLNSPMGGIARKAMHLARKETPRRPGRRERSLAEGQPDIETEMEIDRNEQPDITPLIRRISSRAKFRPSRLKCRNSLYSPAFPDGTAGRPSPRRSS